jgi:hypothetical protein
MPILIKPFLFLVAFAPIAVLFASVFGLACLLLMTCVRAIAWLAAATEMLLERRKLDRANGHQMVTNAGAQAGNA